MVDRRGLGEFLHQITAQRSRLGLQSAHPPVELAQQVREGLGYPL